MTDQQNVLRPKDLAHYLGQDDIKEVLSVAIRAAKARGEPLDHVLLNGPPGLGKTTLANIIATEMGWKIKPIIGPSISKPWDLAMLLLKFREGKTILFIDEVHRVRLPVQEILYPVLEDNRLMLPNAYSELPIKPLTIIGATTNMGKLAEPFVMRFPLRFQLHFYSLADLTLIVGQSAKILQMKLEDGAAQVVAARAQGTPRIANSLLKRIRDFAETERAKISPDYAIHILWDKFQIDSLGLGVLERNYLTILDDKSNGIGVNALAVELGENEETLITQIEPFLLQTGLIERRRNGRWITQKGSDHLESVSGGGPSAQTAAH